MVFVCMVFCMVRQVVLRMVLRMVLHRCVFMSCNECHTASDSGMSMAILE